ncbi:hypothetical protein CsatB_005901 [Cannabis sativa]|uniref:Uncharacterized protein n=1 Tax=Cannabis sativa TaxID=3483 RepID=A0A7J6FHA4_CANSA|nr:uncharacterized protein LOC115707209 [Cannabis sativa]KAF4370076.1 hypothetical protein G4B88_028353 [Cannabis sativa]
MASCCSSICSLKSLFIFFVLSAIPIAYLVSLELATPATPVFFYRGPGWFRECAKWDDHHRRFLISSFAGAVSQLTAPDDHSPETVLSEVPLIKDADVAGNATLGLVIDRPRNRLLVVAADLMGNRYAALLAYDLTTLNRLFHTQLSGPNDEKSLADDVAVDAEGNAYVTDCVGNKIWKVGVDGKFISIIRNPLFTTTQWYKNLVGLNGIVYHQDGFLIAVHTFSGNLLKIDLTKGEEVKLIKVAGGPLTFGDGLELLSPTKLVVAGRPSARLVESSDGWETASVVATFSGPKRRMASAATVKDGKVYLNHLFGLGFPKPKHAIIEAVF